MKIHKPTGNKTRHTVNFLDPADVEAVALAQLGFNNEAIQRHANLTDSQIQYRLTKAKNAEGYAKGTGYRSTWRDGTSEVARSIANHYIPGLRKEVRRTLPTHFMHPPGEISQQQNAA